MLANGTATFPANTTSTSFDIVINDDAINEVDETIIGGVVVVFGLITQAFVGLISIIALVPFVGPIIAKLLALPVFWLINALGYFVSIVAIKKGYSKDVLNYRVLTIVLLIGIVIGYIIGKII